MEYEAIHTLDYVQYNERDEGAIIQEMVYKKCFIQEPDFMELMTKAAGRGTIEFFS